MVAVLASLLLANQQPTITFESTGITVKAFCQELARQAGSKFAVWDEIQTDLLAVHLTAAPLDQVLKKILFAERAKQNFDGATYNIRPDLALRERLRDEELACRAKKIKSIQDRMRPMLDADLMGDDRAKAIATRLLALRKLQNDAPTQEASTSFWLQEEDEELKLPTGNVLLQLFLSIPPEDLAEIPSDGYTVWSNLPTSLEKPFPVNVGPVLNALAQNQRVWADAAALYNLNVVPTSFVSPQIDANPTKVLRLEIHGGGQPILELTGFGGDGKVSFTYTTPTWTPEAMSHSPKPSADVKKEPPAKPLLVPLPPTTAAFLQLWTAWPPEPQMTAWAADPKFLDIYFNPDKTDPIAQTFGFVMVELAKGQHKQLLASEFARAEWALPEDTVTHGALNLTSIDSALCDSSLQEFATVQYAKDDTWITVRPGTLANQSEFEFSRPDLGQLYRTARENHQLTIMDVARFAAGTEGYFGPSVKGMNFLNVAIPDLAGYNLLQAGDWQLKAFFGRLSDMQIAAAQQQDGLPLANCAPEQLNAFIQMLRFARFKYHGQTDVWKSYPTDGLPNGVPGGGVLHLSVRNGEAFQVTIGEPGAHPADRDSYYSVDDLATRLTPKSGHKKYNSYTLQKIRPMTSQTYVFDFDFPDDTSIQFTLDDYRPAGKAVSSIDSLPEPIQGQLKDALQKEATK